MFFFQRKNIFEFTIRLKYLWKFILLKFNRSWRGIYLSVAIYLRFLFLTVLSCSPERFPRVNLHLDEIHHDNNDNDDNNDNNDNIKSPRIFVFESLTFFLVPQFLY